MKKYILTLALGVSSMAFSQVIINANTATAKTTPTNTTSVLLEFGNDGDKGIVLPYVEILPSGTNDAKGGTLVFDVSANSEYKVKVKNETTGWTDLSVQSGYNAAVASDVKTPQATPLEDNSGAKVIIGNETSDSDGVLVLESDTKAMILPIVEDYKAIKNPSAGMIAFLKHPSDNTKHRLIVFNGQKWAFWEAN